MGKREEIGEYIKYNLKINTTCAKLYLYPLDKIIKKIKKYYDRNISSDCVVAFIDETLFGGGKNGMVFTTTGVYRREMLEKPFYFNYWDIDEIILITHALDGGEYREIVLSNAQGDNLAYMKVILSNEAQLIMSSSCYDLDNLKNVLLRLKEITSADEIDSIYTRTAGTVEKKKVNLMEGQKRKCNTIIHGAATAAGAAGAGMAQLLVADAAVITPIQIGMVVALGDVFGFTVTEGLAKGIIKGAMAATVGRGAVQLLAGWIPGIGNAINTATAAGLTEAIGWMAVQEFYSEQVELISKDTFEAKFRRQADAFLNEKKVWFEEKKEYEKLLDECISHIKELETKIERKDGQIEKLEMELAKYRWYYEHLSNLRVG